jgi:hypothetical protein
MAWDDEDEVPEDYQPPLRALEAGEVLYHGTAAPKGFLVPGFGNHAWFSDSHAVAVEFAYEFAAHYGYASGAKPVPRILKFEVLRAVELPFLDSKWEFDHFMDSMGYGRDMDVQEMAELCCQHYDGWWIPNNYSTGADIMLCSPDRILRRIPARSERSR